MKHSEYIKEIPFADTCIVFIHGILGTPNHFSAFIPYIPKNWSVYNILLEGHGKSADDFAAATMESWRFQIAALLSGFSEKYKYVFIAAHSMGTLLAINAAINHPEVKGLFLLDVPMRVFVKPSAAINSAKVLSENVPPNDREAVAIKRSLSVAPDKNRWKYAKWIPNYLSLLAEIRDTRQRLRLLQIPCRIYQSKKDELVSLSSIEDLKTSPFITCNILENSGHFCYEKSDLKFLLKEFSEFCGINGE